jgi:CyaY protein
MDDKTYRQLADETLEGLVERFDEIDLNELDVEVADGVLTVIFEKDGKRLIVSRQSAAHQLWLAEPGGGWHFNYKNGAWVCDKRGIELRANLQQLILDKIGKQIDLSA